MTTEFATRMSMNAKTFTDITRDFDAKNDNTMNSKGDEYSTCGDRMWNFVCVASILENWLQIKVHNNDMTVTPAEAAWMLSLKHDASIIKMLAEGDIYPIALLQEKFGDKGIYNKLVHGMLVKDTQDYKE